MQTEKNLWKKLVKASDEFVIGQLSQLVRDEENLPLFFSRYIMHRGQPFMGPSMQIA